MIGQKSLVAASEVGRIGVGAVDVIETRRYEVPEDQRGRPDERGTSRAEADAAGGGTMLAAQEKKPSLRRRLRATIALVRSNPTGRIALKVFVAIAGALVVILGIALIPLPGPGWLLVIGGLGIWAVEYHWARRLLAFTRRHVHAWTRWVGQQSWPVRIMLGAVGLLFVTGVIWLSLKYSLGIDVVADVLGYLATH